ncbi:MAG: hypothetical protein P4L62_02225 [Candidatus Pacebacteria bacterium]|nr:hypothetical protein [Candidatus Paceibacterota bacterium]MDR3583152.1 hypothetical protein [Candidatus Paceibacterota bacterium]
MQANNFVKIVKDLAVSKKLDWTSFREKRMWEVGKNLENKQIDVDQAITEMRGEFKSYEISDSDAKAIKEKLR